jgi:hypothetical protein
MYENGNYIKICKNKMFKMGNYLIAIQILFSTMIFCVGCQKPPDISACNRLEIECPYGIVNQFFLINSKLYEAIFNTEERTYIHSFDKYEIKDQNLINVFALKVSLGNYKRRIPKEALTSPGLKIICYHNTDIISSFEILPDSIQTEDGRIYKYPSINFLDIRQLIPQDVIAYDLRAGCAHNLESLSLKIVYNYYKRDDTIPYPEPNIWCDIVLKGTQNGFAMNIDSIEKNKPKFSGSETAKIFVCPSVRELVKTKSYDNQPNDSNLTTTKSSEVSNYAMNPNCTKNSPRDMVLLFETKAGWNQHGGPQLFTFDNHDPKGGCVLLNDGTVKFIRTKEELNALRWK